MKTCLSDAEFVGRFQWRTATAADDRGTVPASERIGHFLRALRAIEHGRLCVWLWLGPLV